ncbi:class I SAM-dependent methyltransferase [Calothrix sp. CCY 0018]|uniref:class I SAM-dependent methyltransferase n=1 Tax=Calothrix sp. CCY 0018 TaxID=3103864 RepID=UPI0039C69FBD
MIVERIKTLVVIGLGVTTFLTIGCSKQNVQAESNSTLQADTPSVITSETPRADVPYVPTATEVVEQMLTMAKVSSNDIVYDLGSGDGRIPITAVKKYNAKKATGVEINPALVQKSQNNAKEAGVSDRVNFLQQDLFKTDLSDATVVTLYLLPEVNLKLRPKLLQELKPGTRIVSHAFDMGEWKPERVEQVKGKNGGTYTIYQWTVPENVPKNLLSS